MSMADVRSYPDAKVRENQLCVDIFISTLGAVRA